MKEDLIEIIDKIIISEYNKSLRSTYCFACSINHYVKTVKALPLERNCNSARNLVFCKSWKEKSKMKAHLNRWDLEAILEYLNYMIKGQIPGHKFSETVESLIIKQLTGEIGLKFDRRRKQPFYRREQSLKEHKSEISIDNISSTDIPNLNKKERQNSKIFSSLYNLFYHLEVSIRNYLRNRLNKIFGADWQNTIYESNLFPHAYTRKAEVELTEYYPKRGDDILNYCNWTDYGKIIQLDSRIWDRKTSKDEFVAHLSTMYKIRNAIAHNAEVVPSELIREMEVFISKFIKIFK